MGSGDVIVWIGLAIVGIWLSIEDLRHKSVRNLDLILAYCILFFLSAIAKNFQTDEILSVVGITVLYLATYGLLVALSGRQLGSGDLWGAGLLGIAVATLAPSAWLLGMALPFAIAFPFAIFQLLAKRQSRFAFLPFIFLALPAAVFLESFLGVSY